MVARVSFHLYSRDGVNGLKCALRWILSWAQLTELNHTRSLPLKMPIFRDGQFLCASINPFCETSNFSTASVNKNDCL